MPKRPFTNAAVTSAEHTHSLHIDSAARPVKRTRTEALDPRSSDRTQGQTSYSSAERPVLTGLKDRQRKRAQRKSVKRTRAARAAQDSAAQSQPAVLSSVGLQECSHWLQSLPEDVIAQSLPLKRVHSATALLLMPSTSDQRQRIQKILEEWHVSQKHKGNKRVFKEVKAELVSKVVEESKRLKTMHKVSATAIPAAPPLPPWATYSAIQASLQNRNSSSAASPKPSS